ncbi:aldehyde dehydrogenase family protein [Candidatus Methylacidiphilum fumarolicum]|uniref:Aldehyde dehydrogenase DhaS n=2 Tax=Candidatus Methylacidiphilum fumarolicum TaxID=591154 RepID=A0ABN8XMM0_9BACT|nr:aldehyde dehydrogenase family protein [Candidatus Methylacidiphilum fumarolicum]MBW6413934.1 aldehyde dehydrogenase family protein [Candidatus Methylacidiphilum fumarolicum]TFE70483.1 betaine-aldehyde dehydrogenase [Candidatus Methylacidiphilum fumarolicum]TFE74799.1 aldehyde dehydrogenase family protein [Candidatus Methylacidiphilum fumarolicum]TFE76045.1 aldehyde dehydrogenase family protein [Candidatus Methylacidiphilum fumarolicum]TFE76371.1 betaine-aldehyde dehydrogenase [Candidatus Me
MNDRKVLPEVESFLTASPKKMLIDGKWVESLSGNTFPSYDPATEQPLALIYEARKEDVDRAVDAARQAYEHGAWSRMSPAERSKLMMKLADLMEKHAEELAQIESLDNGKPLRAAQSSDVPASIELFRYMAGWATKIEGNTIPFSLASPYRYLAYILKEPIGVVGQIIPWNYPLLMATWKLAPALATGCTIILKPAEQTPLTALRLGELIVEAGFPEGVVNILPGFGETAGAAIANHCGIDKVAFTGSTEVGKSIVRAAVGNLKKLTLELGGKSPNIVFADAELDKAIGEAANAAFINSGQNCCAGSRLFIEKKIYEEFTKAITQQAKELRVGPGFDPNSQIGPLISAQQLQRVSSYVQSGIRQGANVGCGGVRVGEKGYFFAPTLLTNVHAQMKVYQEEIFGPVVCAVPFDSEKEEDLIKMANETIYGLAAGIWTKDISKAHRLAAKIKAGTVWINCYNVDDPALPFGGYKQSGWGREMGHEVLENYLQTKSVCVQL